MADRAKTETLTLRLSADLRQKLSHAQGVTPYRMTITSIVERGIVLALRELEQMNTQADRGGNV